MRAVATLDAVQLGENAVYAGRTALPKARR